MKCPNCSRETETGVSYCRDCGRALAPVRTRELDIRQRAGQAIEAAALADPDQLTGRGVGRIFAGDGFFVVAVLLAALESPINSLLWLLLLIPAFYFFGKGFADVLFARQMRRRNKAAQLAASQPAELHSAPASVIDMALRLTAGELALPHSVTEPTTRNLGQADGNYPLKQI